MQFKSRQERIAHYGQAHTELVQALHRFPQQMWHFKSDVDSWTIHDIVIHIVDSEANSYARCRRCIAEPGGSVMAYDENRWAIALNYAEQDAADALELFRWLRRLSHRLIENLPEPVWSQTIDHPENGTMTLDDWLDVYTRHVPEHVAQMERIYDAWRNSAPDAAADEAGSAL